MARSTSDGWPDTVSGGLRAYPHFGTTTLERLPSVGEGVGTDSVFAAGVVSAIGDHNCSGFTSLLSATCARRFSRLEKETWQEDQGEQTSTSVVSYED
jgi:hypothetical protein